MVCLWIFAHRSQEEESLQAAIALSKQDNEQEEGEGEGEVGASNTNTEDNLLLDFGSTGAFDDLYLLHICMPHI